MNNFSAFRFIDKSKNIAYLDFPTDYKFASLLENGIRSNAELASYMAARYPNMNIDFGGIGYGCSAFAKGTVYGRNFDMSDDAAGACIILHTAPKDGYASYSTVNLGFLGINDIGVFDEKTAVSGIESGTSPLLFAPYLPLDGINEKGLAVSILQLNYPEIHENDKKTNLTSTTMIRYILDKAANVDEALALFESVNLHTDGYAYHYLIADKSGKSAAVEYVNNALAVKREHHTAVANMFVTEEALGFYGKDAPDDSYTRMGNIDSAILKYGEDISNPDNALDAVKKGAWQNTRYSIVYDLSENNIRYTFGGDFDKIHLFEDVFAE